MTTTDLWYVSRGSGLVLLAVLTLTIVAGALASAGWSPPTWPRFVVHGLHRTLALFAVALALVHVVSAELDPFVQLGWLAMVVPFTAPYRTLWVGMGALTVELLAAVVVTSLLRARLGRAAWRSVHALVLLAWPLTLVHVIGMGPDLAIPAIAVVVAVCAGVGLLALLLRSDATPGPAPAGSGAGSGPR